MTAGERAQSAAAAAVESIWLTILARGSVILLTLVMIPSGFWVIASIVDLAERQRLDEQWRVQQEHRSTANAAEIRTLLARIGGVDVEQRGVQEQLRGVAQRLDTLNDVTVRVEQRIDAALSRRSGLP